MKKFFVVGAIALAGLGLVGCGGESPDDPYNPRHIYMKTNDDRTVYCLSWARGFSCDWDNAK